MDNSFEKKTPSPLAAFARRFDFVQFATIVFLSSCGLLFIYGIGQQIGGRIQDYWWRQLLWLCVGFAGWAFFSFAFPPKQIRIIAPLIYLASLFLLVAVLVQGREVNTARSWINVAGFRFQPSEFGKTGVIVMLAWLLSLREFDINKPRNLACVVALAGISFLLICIEPDLGTAIVLIPVTFFMIFVAGLSWKWILAAIVAICIMIPAGYPLLKEYQKERIRVFLDPERDPRNRGWNSLQAELAVGSGGLHGKGFMQGTQHALGFLPQTVSNTDFIFSVIGEETGFVGASAIIAAYILLSFSLLRTATLADPFGRYLAAGVAAMIFCHSFINIAMTVRLLPITGLPLPLISYGGTFTMNTLVLLGMANASFYRRNWE